MSNFFWIPSWSRNEQPKRNTLIKLNAAFAHWGLVVYLSASWLLSHGSLGHTVETLWIFHWCGHRNSIYFLVVGVLPHVVTHMLVVENIQNPCLTAWIWRVFSLFRFPHFGSHCESCQNLVCTLSCLGLLTFRVLCNWRKKYVKRWDRGYSRKSPQKIILII